MATLRRAFSSRPIVPAARVFHRLIHLTPVVLKKGKGSNSTQIFSQDLDGTVEGFPEGELFGSVAALPDERPAKIPVTSGVRVEKFDLLLTSTLQHLSKGRKMGNPPRKTVLQQLCIMANTKEQLEKVLGLVTALRNIAVLNPPNDFLNCCVTLRCPELALRVLQERPKYGLDISSLEVARNILNSLAYRETDDSNSLVTDCLAFAELYPLYGFPPASQDLISSTILAGLFGRQILNHEGPEDDSSGLTECDSFREIIEGLRTTCLRTGSAPVTSERERRWIRRSMDYIIAATKRGGGSCVPMWLLEFNEQIKMPVV